MADRGSRTELRTGLVFDIKRFALHDGPGIRTTVFLKGCPLTCFWCHNPESQAENAEILFQSVLCVGCGACVPVCPVGAIALQGEHPATDRLQCMGCGACVRTCPEQARSLCGQPWTAAGLVDRIERDTLFFDQSNGGITLSGGEPLMQPEFCRDILESCRHRRIHTAVDTCGHAEASALQSVAEFTDLFLFDIKAVDDRRHQAATGLPSRPILENLRRLDTWGSRLWIRIPLIPGFNDDPEELHRIGEFAATIRHAEAIQVLPYHATGIGKNERIGRHGTSAPLHPLSDDHVDQAAEILRRRLRVPVTIGG